MLFLTLLLLYFFLFIGSSCGQLHMHTYLFSLFVVFVVVVVVFFFFFLNFYYYFLAV